jgi:hypothetical protein
MFRLDQDDKEIAKGLTCFIELRYSVGAKEALAAAALAFCLFGNAQGKEGGGCI